MTGSQQSATSLRRRALWDKEAVTVTGWVVSPKVAGVSRVGKESSRLGLGRAESFFQTVLGRMLESEHKLGSNTSLDWNACTASLSHTGPAANPAAPGLCRVQGKGKSSGSCIWILLSLTQAATITAWAAETQGQFGPLLLLLLIRAFSYNALASPYMALVFVTDEKQNS